MARGNPKHSFILPVRVEMRDLLCDGEGRVIAFCGHSNTDFSPIAAQNNAERLADLVNATTPELKDGLPDKPGYHWAQWRIAEEGTHEGEELCPSNKWEIVEVHANRLDTESEGDDDDEAFRVFIPGVRESQRTDCFVWGGYVAPLNPKGIKRR